MLSSNPVTLTTIFFRLLNDDVRDGNLLSENEYGDVVEGDWFNCAISTLTKLGIVNGIDNGRFLPDRDITRAEFAVICARFDDSEYEVSHTFADTTGHWAEEYILEAAAHGWIRGYEDGTFKPDQAITRAEAMTLINRVLNRIPETVEDFNSTMVEWPDNSDLKKWYYIPVQEATNTHDYREKNHIYKKWINIGVVRDWTEYEK